MEFGTPGTLRAAPSRREKSLGVLTMKFVSLLQQAEDGVLDLKMVSGTAAGVGSGRFAVHLAVFCAATLQTAAGNKRLSVASGPVRCFDLWYR